MGLAKGDTRHQPLDHEFQCQFGRTQRAHAVVNSTWTEPTLRDLEATTLSQQEVFRRHTYVVEQHFPMAMRRIVITEHGQHAQYSHARASRGTRICDCWLWGAALGSSCPSRLQSCIEGRLPPTTTIAAVDDVAIAIPAYRGLDIGRVRGATRGSVIRKAERISPASSGFSHLAFCAALPYRCITSIFPVSGAEQLNTSDAQALVPSPERTRHTRDW